VIFGIGTDIVAIARLQGLWERHGERTLDKVLALAERTDFVAASDPGRFLAKRFAAKEALAKALGSGVRGAVTLPAIAVTHDALGKPLLEFFGELAAQVAARGLRTHLSLSDERDYVVAFVVVEQA
jgi:holo-[acyl-carrier protein] synthase